MSRYYGSDESQEHQPITWLGGYAIYATHLIVVVFVVAMIVTTLLGPGSALTNALVFHSGSVLQGQVWRIATYGLVSPASIQFALDMVMIVWFGREVEKFFGRGKFLALFAGIYLLPTLALTALGPWIPSVRAGEFGALGVFVAFATLYPRVPLMFNILAQWAALILVAIYTLMALGNRDWAWLVVIWAANGYAHGFIRFYQGQFSLPSFRVFKRKPKLRVLPDLPESERRAASPARAAAEPDASMAEIDALLDKIAQSGIGSLTAKERAKLEKGRERLLKKEPGRR